MADDYHGTIVRDPYRWLERDTAPSTLAWIAAQNELTRSGLDGPLRDRLRRRVEAAFDTPRASVPIQRAGRYFFTLNPGLLPHACVYAQDGPSGPPRLVLDPGPLSPDSTVALTAFAPSHRGRFLAYALSVRGSDRQDIAVRDLEAGEDLADQLRWVKFAAIAWLPDDSGFFYTRFPEPGTVPPGDEQYFCQVWRHLLGTPQAADRPVFGPSADPEIVFGLDTATDGRYLVITGHRGASTGTEIHLFDLRDRLATPFPLLDGFDAAYTYVASVEERLYFISDGGAPHGRLVALDPSTARLAQGKPALVEVVPEAADRLDDCVIVDGTILATYLHAAASRVRRFDLDGRPRGDLELPRLGTVTDLTGQPDDVEALLGFTSFADPPAAFRLEVTSNRLHRLAPGTWRQGLPAPRVRQVSLRSADGTPVSMFLVLAGDLPWDGRRPVLLSGYGGFDISLTPTFSPLTQAWIALGGVYAVANVRGGGEYGEAWHQAGMRQHKQNTFDDFLAAARWLHGSGLTNPRRLAIEGGSNGGLLVAAALVQAPSLFGAVICRVPVVDMLRYHRFTVGRFWVPEYGSSDEPDAFEWLHAYSPYHNVRDGVAYPATLIMTADTDDRVAPSMARKFAARLQAATAGEAPVLLRVETRAGHGAGKPVHKQIDEGADMLTFLMRALDVPHQTDG